MGTPSKIMTVTDGYILMGKGFTDEGGQVDDLAWVMKLDEGFEQSWYREYVYEQCDLCTNTLYDIEQTEDGGYIMVGEYLDGIDPAARTWILKVDACGDEQWMGCEEPNGLFEEFEGLRVSELEVWPNPIQSGTSAPLSVRLPYRVEVVRVEIIDMFGRISDSTFLISEAGASHQKLEIRNQELSAGMYSVVVTSRDGHRYSGKFVVE
jgi:hypothetical protein